MQRLACLHAVMPGQRCIIRSSWQRAVFVVLSISKTYVRLALLAYIRYTAAGVRVPL